MSIITKKLFKKPTAQAVKTSRQIQAANDKAQYTQKRTKDPTVFKPAGEYDGPIEKRPLMPVDPSSYKDGELQIRSGQWYSVIPKDPQRTFYRVMRDLDDRTFVFTGFQNIKELTKLGTGNRLPLDEVKAILKDKPDYHQLQFFYKLNRVSVAEHPEDNGREPIPVW